MWALGAGRTDRGRVRPTNEDVFFLNNDVGLYVVSDGMGGHAAGEVAAELALRTVVAEVGRGRSTVDDVRAGRAPALSLEPLLRKAIAEASRAVHARATADQALAGMGCTLTALLVVGDKAAIGHVGDTRLYLAREGRAHVLTSDHTLAADLAESGRHRARGRRGSPDAHVLTRAVGAQPAVQVDTLVLDVSPGDRLLLCSDGLSHYLKDEGWLAGVLEGDDLDAVVDHLVEFANGRGGSDNITALAASASSPTRRAGSGRVPGRRGPGQARRAVVGLPFLRPAPRPPRPSAQPLRGPEARPRRGARQRRGAPPGARRRGVGMYRGREGAGR